MYNDDDTDMNNAHALINRLILFTLVAEADTAVATDGTCTLETYVQEVRRAAESMASPKEIALMRALRQIAEAKIREDQAAYSAN